MRAFPVEDVWGIGQTTARKLQAFGVTTAARLVAELRGVLGIPLELASRPRAQKHGRDALLWPAGIVEAISTHATRAGEKLRAQGLVAGQLTAFLQTNPHKPGPRHDGTRSMRPSQ